MRICEHFTYPYFTYDTRTWSGQNGSFAIGFPDPAAAMSSEDESLPKEGPSVSEDADNTAETNAQIGIPIFCMSDMHYRVKNYHLHT